MNPIEEGSLSAAEEFYKKCRSIASNIHLIIQKTSEINKSFCALGTPHDTTHFRKKLHEIQHDTEKIAKDTSHSLKIVNQISNKERDAKGALTLEMRQRKMEKERLNESFSKALDSFQKAQRSMNNLVQKFPSNSMNRDEDSKNVATDTLINIDEEDSKESSLISNNHAQLLIEENEKIKELEERENAVRQLESDILDVNTIFKDLSMMVHEQGDVVDTIENNVEHTLIQVQGANEQLQKAAEYKRKSNKCKFFVVLGVLVMFLILVIAISVASG